MNSRQAEKLISRYFEGKTTVFEERRLYDYFSGGDIPGELEEYAEMFRDLAAAAGPALPKSHLRRVRTAVAAAAAVAVVALAAVWGSAAVEERSLERLYGGSYMVVDGKRTDNLREMKGEIHSTLREAAGIEHKVAALQSAAQSAEDEVLTSIPDPKQRKEIEELLN